MLQPCRIFSEHHASIMISISPFAQVFGHFIFKGAIGPSSNISILHLYKSLDAFLCSSEGEELGISPWNRLMGFLEVWTASVLPEIVVDGLLYIQLPKVARCIFQVSQVTRDVFFCPDSKDHRTQRLDLEVFFKWEGLRTYMKCYIFLKNP